MSLLAAAVSGLAIALALRALLGSRVQVLRRQSGRLWLAQAGLDVSPSEFWLSSVGAGVLTYLAVLSVTSLPVVALVPGLVVATLPRAYFTRRRHKRLAEVQQTWPDGLRDLISSVNAGASLPMAVESLALFGPAPLRQAFAPFPALARSLGFVAALETIRDNLADPTSDRVIEVLILAYEKGGAVVPLILTDLAEATTKDVWTMEQVRTEALEQKINSRVVFALPWLVLVAITSRSGAFREFYSSDPGLLVVMIGGLMSLVGIFMAGRLGSHPDEPRVFGGAGRL